MSIHEILAIAVLIVGGIITVFMIIMARKAFTDMTDYANRLNKESQSFWEEEQP